MSRWVEKGFEAFARGCFGNSGRNLYVSREGVLQRIFRFDTTNSGYTDLIFTNSHEFNEHPPLQIIDDCASDTAKTAYVRTNAAHAAALADLNGDGYDDLIIGTNNNGHHSDLAAFLYYGGPDGITENNKVELSAPGCVGVAAGDFNGDGLIDLAFIIEGSKLRIYTQSAVGFLRDSFVDVDIDLTHIEAGDIDEDGCADLYCRIRSGDWIVLWGGRNGIELTNATTVGEKTDDSIYETLPLGGGNLKYAECARPKILDIDDSKRLFYSNGDSAFFIPMQARRPGTPLVIDCPCTISAAAGDIDGDGCTDLVLLSRAILDDLEASFIYYGGKRQFSRTTRHIIPTTTARDAIVCDFAGNGFGAVAVCQGRDQSSYTTESLLFEADRNGLSEDPRRFVTHDAVGVLYGSTNGKSKQLLWVNHQESQTYGHVPIYIYKGGPDGYSPDIRIELTGHSPGQTIPCDFNDDGWPDILLINDGEDQPQPSPASTIFWGGPDGFSERNCCDLPTHLSWGAQVGDINKDGYLDIIATSASMGTEFNKDLITIFFGSSTGYSAENAQVIDMGTGTPEEAQGLLWPMLADFNKNGWLDLFVPLSAKCESIVFWGGPDGLSIDRSTRLPVERALCATAADLNGNGWLDLIIGTRASEIRNKGQEGSVIIYWGGLNGFTSSRCCELPSYQTNSLVVADFNNNGSLDIFASCYFNGKERDIDSYIYWNDNGNFSVANRKRLFSHSSSGCFAADLNGNGYTDLVIASHRAYGNHRAESVIWWNGPDGFDEKRRSWLPTLGPHSMCRVETGNLEDRGDEEYYTSSVFEMPADSLVTGISWLADVPTKTWVRAQLRTASSHADLENSHWYGPAGIDSWFERNTHTIDATITKGTFVQYRIALGSINSGNTPRVTEIAIEYG